MKTKRVRTDLLLFWFVAVPGFIGLLACQGPQETPAPVVYHMTFPDLEAQVAEIEIRVPTEDHPSVELMMPRWSPGFYRVQDYAGKVMELSARSPDGETLPVERTRPNRWRIQSEGNPSVLVTYRLHCPDSFVTTNWVSPELLVLNGGATYMTIVGAEDRPHEVWLEPAPTWTGVATGLPAVEGSGPHHYLADDYDTLVDAPIVAGDLETTTFLVEDVEHHLVDVGERTGWDPERAAADLKEIVEESIPLWGELPYRKYVFLNVFRRGGGGLEHENSTLLTTSAETMATPQRYRRWLSFASHEYFHALNVKRLRPVELGPFDYEVPPRTSSLWFSEGCTSYFGDLLVARAGLMAMDDYLASLSSAIRSLQNSPGRLLQSLEQSSLEVWTNSNSGVGAAPSTVSYYVKGEVVGFLLDAKIRTTTDGRRTLEDVVRLAYERYGGERGFTPDELRATAEEVAGATLEAWFERSLASTEELDYSEALDWYGLRFSDDDSWTLEILDDASARQTEHLKALLAPAGQP
jgi:predicted metalloprotease with PDZ domain